MTELTETLGFEEQDVNLFELFNKNQTKGADSKSVDLTEVIKQDDNKSKADPNAQSKTPEQLEEDRKAAELKAQNDIELKKLLDEATKKGGKAGTEPDKNQDKDGGGGKGSDKDNKDDTLTDPLSIIYSSLAEKGILEKIEGFDGTDESLEAAVQATVDKRLAVAIDEEIDAAFNKVPGQAQLAKDFIKHLGNGGTVDSFQTTRQHLGIDIKQLDSEKEEVKMATATKVLSTYYGSLGWEQARIDRAIERSKTKGVDVMVDEAKDIFPEYQKAQDSKKTALDTELANKTAADKQRQLDFNKSLTDTITGATEIAGFDVSTPAAKKKLNEYMFTPSVEVNGKKVPKFLADRAKELNSPSFIAAQALLLMNGLKIDTKTAQTSATKTVKEKLEELQKSKSVTATGTGTDNKDNRVTSPTIFDFEDTITIK